MNENWRSDSVLRGIPSNSQIFGRLLRVSGVNGIKYSSKHTNKKCIAIFTETFENSSCSIKIIGSTPDELLVQSLNLDSYKQAGMTAKEIIQIKHSH